MEKILPVLNRLMKVTSLKDEDGSPLRYEQCIPGFEDREQLQANTVEAVLERALPAGQRKINSAFWA